MPINLENFKVEYESRPVGVATRLPRFSWQILSDEKNVKQEGYRIKVYEWLSTLVWDSGFVKSDETVNIQYKGKQLDQDTAYFVECEVKVNGKDYLINSEFRTGIFSLTNCCTTNVMWIRPDQGEKTYEFAPYFRKDFNLESDEIAFATAYISARGWAQPYINGKRLDEKEVMAPSHNRIRNNAYLRAYDVTDFLKQGKNTVGVVLGNGYSGHFRPPLGYNEDKALWGFISVTFTDGSFAHIVTDKSWKWSKGPITMDHIYDGEWYDATKEIEGWNTPDYCDEPWANAAVSEYANTVVPLFAPPVRILGTRECIGINKIDENKYIYDFKYNGSGVLKIKVKGDRGAEIIMHHAENIFPDGTLQPWTNRNAEATDRYILKGDGEEVYIPTFTYHCFRYVEFTVKGNAEILSAEALVYGTDMFNESRFECSSHMLNRIQDNFIRTLKTNFMAWPADTGVRDERTACDMDTLVYQEMAMHNCNIYNYYKKWTEKGIWPAGNPDWGGNDIVLAWQLWKYYGDTDYVKSFYPQLRSLAWAMYDKYELDGFEKGFGDWAAPNPTNEYEDSFSSVVETNMAMFCLEISMLKEIAEFLGEREDICLYNSYIERVKEDYIEKFFNPKTCLFSEGKQTPNLLAISNGIVEGELKEKVLKALIGSIKEKDNSHLDTGIFGTRKLIEVLSEAKEGLELVYDILHQTTYPSFGHQIVGRDATTAWEQWYHLRGMMTCSHSMFAGIGADFYKVFAGIKNAENMYKKAYIKPVAPDKMTYVNCTLDTPRGIFKVNWNKADGEFKLEVSIPANCSATVELPNGEAYCVESGEYSFKYNM